MATAPQQTNFDWKSMYFLSQDSVKEYSNNLRKNPTIENLELADMIDATPAETFSPSFAQKKMGSLLTLLQKREVPDEMINEFLKGITSIVYNTALQKISDSMTEDIRAYWDEVLNNDPSIYQVIYLMNFYTNTAFSVDLDEFLDQIISNIVDEYKNELDSKLAYEEMIEKLSDEETSSMLKELENGDISSALNILVHKNR